MDKRYKNNTRILRRKSKRRRQLFTILLVFIILLAGSTTLKAFASLRTTGAIGLFTKEIFATMIVNNPIKLKLNEEIKRVEQENIELKLESIRYIEKKKKETEEEIKRIENEIKEKNTKIAYLTFDDGPSKNVTPRILDILSEYDIKATFFVLGKMTNINPEMLKRTHNEGHAIAHHSYSHDYNFIYKNTNNFIGELEKTNKKFQEILGEDFQTKLLRFPGGSFEKKKQKFIVATEKLGYTNYDWNALNGDAEGHNLPKKHLINRLKSTVTARKEDKEIIILMHDTDAKSTTADALPEIIDFLIKEGYEFRTLEEK